ncbi:hypothetical protein Y032_0074g898 [Ancylostoma ceylanicum]|uniref:Uncharacterized protein n=1 Tax=Ancylostoma ceylanicum TaxID=53326 RepID=A0A016TWQ3_9BILA|nr:hypothetical protein Y032_0074g898 [Ancylostoma ceylanicum]
MKYVLVFLLLNVVSDLIALKCVEEHEDVNLAKFTRGVCQSNCLYKKCQRGVCVKIPGKRRKRCRCFSCPHKVLGIPKPIRG